MATTVAVATPIAPSLWFTYGKLVLATVLWSGTFVAGRILSDAMSAPVAAVGRFAVALALLLFLVWKFDGGLPKLSLRQWGVTAVLGLTGVCLYNLFFLLALGEMSASRTAMFVALNPAITALVMVGCFGERFGKGAWLGIGAALSGALLVITRADLSTFFLSNSGGQGEWYMTGAVLSWVAYTLVGRRALQTLTPLAATTYAAIWGLLFLLMGLFVETGIDVWQPVAWHAVWAVVYLGIGGTVLPFVWYYQGVNQIGPARTAVFTNLVPVFGVLLGVLFLDEPLSPSMLLGVGLVLLGVVLTNRTR